jgi:LuxR family transcriptional regulator, maltose regulon positive regulatory protein
VAETRSKVVQGNEALGRGAWEEARAYFEEALADGASAEAFEGLSWAAWWLNEADLLIGARESAYRAYRDAGDPLAAARMALWLAGDFFDFRGEVSLASGWRQRAHRLLKGLPLAPEHGWLALIEGDHALTGDEDTTVARANGARAIEIGRELRVTDIEMIGLAMEGLALVCEGEADAGMKRLDEAAAAALGGDLKERFSVTWTFCYLIYACERVRDYDRAAQWCERMRQLADSQQIKFALGICRAHYAGVLIWRGKWNEAESELYDATDLLQASRPPYAVEGIVRLAELRRRQGRLQEAEEMFRQVEWHPLALFGLSEVALDAGRPRDAEELTSRALRQITPSNRLQRAAGLELLVRARALQGNQAGAAQALASILEVSEAVPTIPLRAAASFSAALVALAARDFEEARERLEDAVDLFEKSAAPYESARARLELASVLVSLERFERAESEAETARAVLERLGSTFHTRRASLLVDEIARRSGMAAASSKDGPGLTPRQIEVLRLISRGLSDREIAAALVVSEHTVHRHVANILERFDVPSRASAVAYAASRGLI